MDQRKHKRVKAEIFVKLKGKDIHGEDFEEVVRTTDLSKTGASFSTTRDLQVGDEVFLSIPLPSKIVRIDKFTGSEEKKYGVIFKQFEPPEEKSSS